MTKIGERIKNRRKELGISVDELAKKLDKNRATIYRYESNEIEDLPASVLKPLALALKTTPAHLMGWDTGETVKNDLPYIKNLVPLNGTPVPIIGTIAAGTPILAEENIEGYAVPVDEVKVDFALRVKGDSMINVPIFDGDIVFIRKQPEVANGEIAAILIDCEATLKRFYNHGDSVMLVSENPKYKPMIYTETNCDDFRILGKAIAYQHSFETHINSSFA